MGSSRVQNAARNATWGVIGRVVSLGLSFVLRTVMIYTLGSEYLGFNSLFTSILQILNMAELGFASAIIYSMYKPVAEKDRETICALLNLYRNIYRAVGWIVLGLGLALIPFLRQLIAGEIKADINIYILYGIYLFNAVFTYWFFAYRSSILIVHQRNDIPTIVTTLVDIVKTVAQILILIFVRNYYCYVIVMPITSILTNMLTAYMARKYYPQYVCRGKVSDAMRKQVKEKTFALLGVKLTALIYNSVDSVVISSFLGLVVLARYNNYYFIMQAIISIIAAVYGSVQSSVGNSLVTETKEKTYSDFLNLTFINAWLVGWCTVCLYSLYQPFMELWVGKGLMFGKGIMICFCLYFYVFQLKAVQSTYKDAAGLWKEDLWRSYASNAVNLVLNIILVKAIGIYGILLSTVFALLVISYPWQTYIIHKKLFKCGMAGYLKRLLYYTVVTVLGCVLTGFICNVIPIAGITGFILKVIVCCIVPNVVFLVMFGKLREFGNAGELVKRLLKKR